LLDDGSSDGTPEVLDVFGNSIRLVKFAKNLGPLAARNHGSSLATGEYLVFLEGDDVLMPWTLQVYERLIATLRPKIILGQRFYFQGEVPPEGSTLLVRQRKRNFLSVKCEGRGSKCRSDG